MKTVISYNISSVRNTDTLHKFVIRIKSAVSAQHQIMIITAMHFKMIQVNIIVQTVKNFTQHDSSDARQDRSRLRRLN